MYFGDFYDDLEQFVLISIIVHGSLCVLCLVFGVTNLCRNY